MRRMPILILSILSMASLTACGSGEAHLMENAVPPASSDYSFAGLTEGAENGDGLESVEDGGGSESVEYRIGDIILSDGSVVKSADLTSIDSGNYPAAVIAGYKADGTAFGLGVHRSGETPQWALDGSAGYTTKFEDTVCVQETGTVFSGDTEGCDNWDVISSGDGKGAADAEKNYPAFYFVNTYAEAYKLSGVFVSGWYMPSIAELYVIYENREIINTSLQTIHELDSGAAMDGLDTNWYWSSSQADSEDDCVWFVHYFNGYAGECPKNFTNLHVLAIRDFQVSPEKGE